MAEKRQAVDPSPPVRDTTGCGCQEVSPYPIHTFARHYRYRYGTPVGKLALDLGVPCLNRARGGCTFCRPAAFTPYYLRDGQGTPSLAEQLRRGRHFLTRRRFSRYFAYFQQESATAAPEATLARALDTVLADPACIGVILATRPDCVGDEVLATIGAAQRRYPGREWLVELGLQSAHDTTLARINRNHDVATFVDAVRRLHARNLAVGVHLILGLPGEDREMMAATVRLVARLGVAAVKFHHLQVIAGTALAAHHRQSPLPLFTDAQAYLELLAEMLALLPARVVVHRLWATADPHLLLAPRWTEDQATLHRRLLAVLARRNLCQGCWA